MNKDFNIHESENKIGDKTFYKFFAKIMMLPL